MKKNQYRVILLSVLGGIGAILVTFLAFPFGTVPWHNGMLWRMENSFASITHPVESALIRQHAYLGTIYESGNSGCYFYAGEMRETSLSREKLTQAYEPIRVTMFGYIEPITVRIVFEEDWPSLAMDLPIYE